jgi:hypothetical protein
MAVNHFQSVAKTWTLTCGGLESAGRLRLMFDIARMGPIHRSERVTPARGGAAAVSAKGQVV